MNYDASCSFVNYENNNKFHALYRFQIVTESIAYFIFHNFLYKINFKQWTYLI